MDIPNEAGRALDALVAQWIMGWSWYTNGHLNIIFPDGEPLGNYVYAGAWTPGKTAGGEDDLDWNRLSMLPALPHYSTRIADAWRVVERIIGYGAETAIYEYFCMGFQDDPLIWMQPEAEACLLICRVALASAQEADI